jgi:hypothetical protein
LRLLAGLAVCLLALFIGAGLALLAERPARHTFRMVRGASDDALWRLNERTGQVSVCGAALTGHALSEMEARLAAHIRAAGHDRQKLAALLPEIDELDDLARPRCSPWSASEVRAELAIDGAN